MAMTEHEPAAHPHQHPAAPHDPLTEPHDHLVARTDEEITIISRWPAPLWAIAVGILTLLILAGFIGWAIGNDEAPPAEVVVSDLDQPAVATGQTITLSGEIDQFITSRLFVLGAEGSQARVLVSADDIPFGADVGSVVSVQGETRLLQGEFGDRATADDTVLIVASEVTLLSPR